MVLLIEPQLGNNEVIICELINSPTRLFQDLTKPAKITLEHPGNGFPLRGSFWGIRVTSMTAQEDNEHKWQLHQKPTYWSSLLRDHVVSLQQWLFNTCIF